jgi:hypothetical protein
VGHIFRSVVPDRRNQDWIVLDNESTVNFFCIPNLVNNIKTTNEMLELSTNGGDLITNKCAAVPECGDLCLDQSAIRNIFISAILGDKYRMT